jgi:acetate kinase
MKILVCNSGSSSLKLGVFEADNEVLSESRTPEKELGSL